MRCLRELLYTTLPFPFTGSAVAYAMLGYGCLLLSYSLKFRSALVGSARLTYAKEHFDRASKSVS